MSKQTSLLTFEGKMGNLSFFKSKGQHRARLRGGMSKDRMLKDPRLSRVRENLQEFSAIALMGKSFRRATSKIKNVQDGELAQRLTKVFTAIKRRAVTTRGQRPILLSQSRSLLTGLELNSVQNFVDVFSAPFIFSHNAARNTATIEIQNLNIREMVIAPPSATHFRLMQSLGFIADTIFDSDTGKFVASSETLNGLNEVSFSDYIPVSSAPLASLSIETSIAGNPTADITVAQGIGILFYENIGTEYYALNQGKAMRIVDLF